MKKIILYPIVCLLLMSSCKSSKVTLNSNLEPTTKVVNQDEIKMKRIDFNHPIFKDPFWILGFNKRPFKIGNSIYIN